MLEALKEAWKAYLSGEVPIGAVLVKKGKILSRGYNQVEQLQDATAHAEMLCLRAGAAFLGSWRLTEATLYCTIEPCAMCAGASILSRVSNLVWGGADLRHGANGSWVNLFENRHPIHTVHCRSGILAEHATSLIQSFFQKIRKEKRKKSDEGNSMGNC